MAYERPDPDRYQPIRHSYREPRPKAEPGAAPRTAIRSPHCTQRAEGDEHVCPTRGCFLRWADDEERPDCPLGLTEGA